MRPAVVLSLVLTLGVVASSAYVWAEREALLEDKVPTHWNASGEPDKFTNRDDMGFPLAVMPGTAVLMFALTFALPWLSPKKFEIEPFRPTFDVIMLLVAAMFAYIHAILLMSYLGAQFDMLKWMMSGILVLFVALGAMMGGVKRNFYVGIRTPWTLASDAVWDATHKFGAWTMGGSGVLGLVLLLAGVHPLACVGLILVGALVPVFYSLRLYKRLEREGRLDKAA